MLIYEYSLILEALLNSINIDKILREFYFK